jgi:hypothetical protein
MACKLLIFRLRPIVLQEAPLIRILRGKSFLTRVI